MRKKRRQKTNSEKKLEAQKRKARYGKNWNQIRKKIYERDGYQCRACGIKGVKLNAHHILLLRVSKSNDHRNLITLCDRCHKILEEKCLSLLKSGGHRFEIVRATYKWLIEMRSKYRNGKLITEEKTE